MCNYKAAVMARTGRLYHHWSLQSHEDIVAAYRLADVGDNLCRIEYSGENPLDIESYCLDLDEFEVPAWADDEKLSAAERELRAVVESEMVTESTDVLLAGSYILMDDVTVDWLLPGVMIQYAGKARVGNAQSATIRNAGKMTLVFAGSATIHHACEAVIEDAAESVVWSADTATIEWANEAYISCAEQALIKHAGTAFIEDAGRSRIKHAHCALIRVAGSAVIEDADQVHIINGGEATVMRSGYAYIVHAEGLRVKQAHERRAMNFKLAQPQHAQTQMETISYESRGEVAPACDQKQEPEKGEKNDESAR